MRRALIAAALLLPLSAFTLRAAADPEVRRIPGETADTVVTTTYHATARASAPTVVLVPGILGSAYTWRKVAPALNEAGHTAVIIEPLGMGASARPKSADYSLEGQAARIGKALDSLGIERATFVCHSVGASICMRLALQRPALFTGIVSLNGGPDEVAATNGLRTALRMTPLLKLFGAERIMRGKVKDGLLSSAADPSWVTDKVVAGYTTSFKSIDAVQNAFRGMVNAKERASLRARLSSIDVPVTLLVGAGKPGHAISAADLKVMVGGIREIRVDSVARAGQYIQEERPDAVVSAVRKLSNR